MSAAELVTDLDTFSFDEDTHTYRNADGIERISVTQALHQVGCYDFSMVRRDVLERKARIGRNVHRFTAEWDCEGEIDETWIASDEIGYFRAWQRLMGDYCFTWEKVEEPQMATILGMEVGFTPDRVGWRNGVRWVVDLKCCTTRHPAWELQTADYEMLLTGRPHLGMMCRMAALLRPDGTYKPLVHDKLADAGPAIGALQLATWAQNNGMRRRD